MVERKFPTSSYPGSDGNKPSDAYTFTASNKTDHEKDVDIDFNSVHHTIGKGPTQVAAGDHSHEVKDISGLTVDHGNLTGLGDDDHVAYPKTDGTRAIGTWPIGISGKAATAGDADTVDGQHLKWEDRGAITNYFWGVNNSGDSHLVYLARFDERYSNEGHGHDYAPSSHGHDYSPSNHGHNYVHGSIHGPATIPGSSTGVSFTVAHGLGYTPSGVHVQALDDTGVQSVVCSISTWDASNVTFLARNLATGAETVRFSVIAVGS